MGYNRSGNKARLKLRRRRREEARLAKKAAAAQGQGGATPAAKPVGTEQTVGG